MALSFSVPASISVSATPNTATFTGTNPPTTSAIAVTSSWILGPSYHNWYVGAYFTTPASALTDGAGDNISVTNVYDAANGGTAVPCNATLSAPYQAVLTAVTATAVCFSDGGSITSGNFTGNKTDSLVLSLQGTFPGTLPAGHTGTLNIESALSNSPRGRPARPLSFPKETTCEAQSFF